MTQPQAELLDLYRAGLKTAADMMKASLESAERLQNQQLVAIRTAIDQQAKSADELDRYLKQVDLVLDRKGSFDPKMFKEAKGAITAEQIYVNQKVTDLISNAEMEQSDYRRGSRPNVFFGAEKRYIGVKVSVFVFNTLVLIGSTLGLLGLLYWILRRQLEVRRT